MVVGPNPHRVDPFKRVPSRYSLLATIEALGGAMPQEVESAPNGDERPVLRWLNGITYPSGLGCGLGSDEYEDAVLPVNCGPMASHAAEGNQDDAVTTPFLVRVARECSTFSWTDLNYAEQARAMIEACESAFVEFELWTGTVASAEADAANQWLASPSAATLSSGAALNPTNALAALEDGLTGCCGDGGVIHIPYGAVEYLVARGLVFLDRSGRYLRTTLGNAVVAGNGYPGTDTAGDLPSDGETWIYATGPLRYWREPAIEILPSTLAEAMTQNEDGQYMNSMRFYGQRSYLVDYDPCCHFAARMSLVDVGLSGT